MRFRASIRTAHRWLALALGLQFAIWAASGVVLGLIPDALARGDAAKLADFTPDLEARNYASPGGIIAQLGGATEVRLMRGMGRVIYVAYGPKGSAVFDARSAERLSPLDETAARLVATQDFSGADQVRTALKGHERAKPVWRITFSDRNRTTLTISAETGEILARQNKYSALRSFFRGLHVMDYSGRGDAHNPLLKLAGATALGFVLTGFGLVVLRWGDGRYRLRSGLIAPSASSERDALHEPAPPTA